MTKRLFGPKTELIILSPHLDDAVFSLGSLLTEYAKTNKIKVINIFTEADTHPPTLSARTYLNQIGESDPIRLFKLRRREDERALAEIGIKPGSWGELDALWRRHKDSPHLPELGANYPTYRLHVSQGRISKYDRELVARLKSKLLKTIPSHRDYRVFAPLGHGGHVDHQLARHIAECMVPHTNLAYYLDFPYSIRSGVRTAQQPSRYTALTLPTNQKAKLRLCERYVSQFSKVIPDPLTLHTPETIYVFDPTKQHERVSITNHLKAALSSPKNYIFSVLTSSKTQVQPQPKPYHDTDQKIQNDFIAFLKKNIKNISPQAIGSLPLKLAGQGDLDILIPVKDLPEHNRVKDLLTKLLGPHTHQTKEMTQWKTNYHGRSVDLDLIFESSPRYLEQNYLSTLLISNPVLRHEYEVFKLNHAGARCFDYEINRICFVDCYLMSHNLLTIPSRLGSLQLVSRWRDNPKYPKSYLFGEYKDRSGERYIAKLHQGPAHSRAARFLQNEYRLYSQLVNNQFVQAPRLFAYHNTSDYRYLILSKIVGHDLVNQGTRAKVQALSQCINFLHSQSQRVRGIQSRPALYWLLLALPLLLLNIARRTLPTTTILRLAKLMFYTAPATLFRPTTIVHRDLNFQNCFKTEDGLALLDYQLTCYADPLLEYAVILLKYYPDVAFTKALLASKTYQKIKQGSASSNAVITFYLVVLGLYDLVLSDGRHDVSREVLQKLVNQEITL